MTMTMTMLAEPEALSGTAAEGMEPLPAPRFPTSLRDKEGRVFSVRPLRPDDRPALEEFYDGFDPKRAAQGLPPEGRPRIARWLDNILRAGTHLVV